MRPLQEKPLTALALPFVVAVLGACGAAPTSASLPTVAVATENADEQAPPGFGSAVRVINGLQGRIYALPQDTARLPDFEKLEPLGSVYTTALNVTPRRFDQGFPGVSDRFEWFGIDYQGQFTVAAAGEYRFRLTADDGAKLFIDGKQIIDNDGIHPPAPVEGSESLIVGQHRIHVPYFQGPRWDIALVLEVAPPGAPFRLFRVDQPLGEVMDETRAFMRSTRRIEQTAEE